MERLTKYSNETTHENGVCCTHFGGPECCEIGGNCALNCKWEEAAWERLARYEDARLSPAEIHSMYGEWNAMMSVLNSIGSYDRLRELAEADRAGRLVVLPCKVGDTVYMISWRLNGRHEIEERVFSLTYFDPAKYGKDYFISREEAEEALRRADMLEKGE